MLLPELQTLAGSLGIQAGKLRKSDLIAAIENAGAGRAPAAHAERVVPNAAPSAAAEPAQAASPEPALAKATTRTRRSASRPAGSAQPTLDAATDAPTTSATAASTPQLPTTNGGTGSETSRGGRSADGESTETPPARQQPERSTRRDGGTARVQADRGQSDRAQGDRAQGDRAQGDRAQNDRAQGERGQNDRAQGDRGQSDRSQGDRGQNDRGQNDRSQVDRAQNDRVQGDRGQNEAGQNGQTSRNSNDRSQSGAGRNPNSGTNQGGGNRNPNSYDDDDEFGGTRRGRRYRDRRGRNRERFDGAAQGGRQESEPTISEDDVLIPVAGILDSVEDKNTWFIRTAGYFASPDDVYVANSHIRRYGLRRGDAVTGAIRQAKEGERKEKFNPLVRLDTVNGVDPEKAKSRVEFTKLTPLYPQDRLRLETEPHILTTRVIDLVMPIGKGQRALVVSPPKAGKTSVLQAIANAIAVNNPECHLMVVLVDERPEEVTDMQRSVKGEVIASTFDRRPQDHTMIAELSIERAKRLVEMGHDVVVLLDSITRLGRAYNLAAPASGRILSGGVDSTALYPPKRFLGAARNIEDGGSLTIIATALVETGSTMDTVIFEEFKGTGNAELKLDRKIADKRVFPAIDVDQSGTRKEEILLSPDELAVVIKLRRVLHALDTQQGIDLLLDRLKKTRTNIEFLMQIAKTAPGSD